LYFYDEIYELTSEQWQGYTIDRKKFDKFLAESAENAGAKLLTSAKAVGLEKRGKSWITKIKSNKELIEIRADIVIGADGFENYIGRWAGMSRKWNVNEYNKCLEFNMYCPELQENDKFHIAFGEEFPAGYGWIFPKKDTANVGVGIDPRFNTKKALHFFLEKYPIVKSILGEKYSINEVRGGGIPSSGPKKIDEVISDGIILVGDAAGMVEPLTGEGIAPSMISGISAGEVAITSIKNNSWSKSELIKYYETWMNKRYIESTLGENMKYFLKLKEHFYKIFSNKINKEKRRKFILQIASLR
jgi:digeranylgeranylglycerophospholipid reductase